LEAGPPSARPAIPSRSPLAEADQRLNIDSFASRFDLPLNFEGQAAAPLAEEEMEHATAEGREFSSSRPDEARRSNDTQRTAKASETAGPPAPRVKTEDAAPRVRPPRETPSHTSTQPEVHNTRRAEPPAGKSPETSTAPEIFNAPRTHRPRTQSVRLANPLPDPSAEDGRTRTPELDATEGGRLVRAKRGPAEEAAAESVFEALGRAMSWVERGGRRRLDEEAAEGRAARPAPLPRAPHARRGEATPVWPARTTPRDTRPVTHLEIGKIEVEVVAPPRPAQTSAPPRPAQSSDGFGRALRQTFGWRQR
jgi:hypothetical protein